MDYIYRMRLVREIAPWDDESKSLSERASLAFYAGKRTRFIELNEAHIRQQKALGDPYYENMDSDGHTNDGPIETTRHVQAEAKPEDPFAQYLRAAREALK